MNALAEFLKKSRKIIIFKEQIFSQLFQKEAVERWDFTPHNFPPSHASEQ